MFTYIISPYADKKAFSDTCDLIKTHVDSIKYWQRLTDVDGTQIQIYDTTGGKIKIYNDYEVDAVYIDSEVNLNNIM